MDEKSYENILIYDVLYKKSNSAKPLRVILIKSMEILENIMEINTLRGENFTERKFLHAKNSPNFIDDPLQMISKDVFTKI